MLKRLLFLLSAKICESRRLLRICEKREAGQPEWEKVKTRVSLHCCTDCFASLFYAYSFSCESVTRTKQ